MEGCHCTVQGVRGWPIYTQRQRRKIHQGLREEHVTKSTFGGHAGTPPGVVVGKARAGQAVSVLMATYQCPLQVAGVCMEDLDTVVPMGGGEPLPITREGHGDGRLGRPVTGIGHKVTGGVTRSQRHRHGVRMSQA